ncbi:hypothetical protein M917_0030 [Psychrobacter aquaticus CMS 56]|uniref:Uncharacterized protein n=1 Tax=Psychrobacter aquaticus CMS 56 TaxID=1354303 RepID=U4TEZ3_9GAMM|nr:hypothetical protein M917_0030 [Psychrobacter aquaticus CMS 56]
MIFVNHLCQFQTAMPLNKHLYNVLILKIFFKFWLYIYLAL